MELCSDSNTKALPNSFLWYLKAAMQNHIIAQYNLGVCYENGIEIEKDLAEAFFWYLKAGMIGLISNEGD